MLWTSISFNSQGKSHFKMCGENGLREAEAEEISRAEDEKKKGNLSH